MGSRNVELCSTYDKGLDSFGKISKVKERQSMMIL